MPATRARCGESDGMSLRAENAQLLVVEWMGEMWVVKGVE